MKEALALIDKIIEEHKTIFQRFQALEQVANDASALEVLDKAKDSFMPGRLNREQGLKDLQELLGKIDDGLQAHFNREETALLAVFEKHGSREAVSALHSLLLEHKDLRERFDHSRRHVAELVSGKLARHRWEASANDMRAHISHTRKLLEAHAAIERELLTELRRKLREKSKSR